MTKLSTVVFSLSSSNIRNANHVFQGVVEKSKEQMKMTRIANKPSTNSRNNKKPGVCTIIFSKSENK